MTLKIRLNFFGTCTCHYLNAQDANLSLHLPALNPESPFARQLVLITAVYRVFKCTVLSILQIVFHFPFTLILFGRMFLSVTRREMFEAQRG